MSTADLHVAQTPGRAHDSARDTQTPLRLTRRGRIVIVATAFLLLLGAFLAFGPSVIATDNSGPDPTTITVERDATLWDIANRVNPGGDVRETIDEIVELNGVRDAGELQIGTELIVPRY